MTSALRAPGIRALKWRPATLSFRRAAEVTELYPGERLVVCPLLAEERTRKREALLRATEAAPVAAATGRSKNRGEKNIGERADRAVAKMKKHFILEIAADAFSWRRNDDSIAAEAALDGRRSNHRRNNAGETVAAYKNLGTVERAFRTFKIPERPAVTTWKTAYGPLLCMLAYYVERAPRASLFDDEDGPVRTSAPAERSARRKAASRRTPDGHSVHSFRSLLDDLSTVARNRVRLAGDREMTTVPTSLQEKALAERSPSPRVTTVSITQRDIFLFSP